MSFSKNYNKIQFKVYRMGNSHLVAVDHVRNLGVIFDRKFDFHEHIKNLSSKCMELLRLVMRASNNFSPNRLKIFYCSLVQSTTEYCSVVWNPQYQNKNHVIV